MTSAVIDWSSNAIGVDSLAVEGGNVVAYLNVPYYLVAVSGTNYRTWIMAEHVVKFDYATYDMPSGPPPSPGTPWRATRRSRWSRACPAT
jgi:starvation-inducible outer membrane lipoprotein